MFIICSFVDILLGYVQFCRHFVPVVGFIRSFVDKLYNLHRPPMPLADTLFDFKCSDEAHFGRSFY
jgi:hypothetical protein